MNYPIILRTLGFVLSCEGGFLVLSMVASLGTGGSDLGAFMVPTLLCFCAGIPLARIKPKNEKFYAKEGFLITGASWVGMVFIGALPYFLGGYIPDFSECLFESAAGFSTTGATILVNIEALPRGILFWRSLTHWLGGMGVLVLTLALVPSSGGSSLYLMRAESTGPSPGKIVPRMRDTASSLYYVYLALSGILLAALLLCGLPLYDALVTMFGTAGTGGFSHLNGSISALNNFPAEIVFTLFMFVCSFNFGLYYQTFTGNKTAFFKNIEARVFAAIVVVATLFMAFNILPIYGGSFPKALHEAAFHVSAAVSTTGYTTVNFNLWPVLSKAILMLLMFMGGSSGSTAGGVKAIRLVVAFKALKREIRRIIHPRQVSNITIDGRALPEETVSGVILFLLLYTALIIITFFVILLDGFDLLTSFSAALTCVCNAGPGLELVGPAGNYSIFSPFTKVVLSFCMLAGRLELYPMLLLINPSTYKKA